MKQAEADQLAREIAALISTYVDDPSTPTPTPTPPGRVLTFEDTFQGGVDWSKWDSVPMVNDPAGNGSSLPTNKEKQWYPNNRYGPTMGYDPWQTDAEGLVITADHTPAWVRPHFGYGPGNNPDLNPPFGPDWYDYGSGRLRTYHAQTYGYFEARMKCPAGKGTWPAFWLLSQDMRWPPEMDVMEGYGHEPGVIHQTRHWCDVSGAHVSAHVVVPVDMTEWHTYGWEWGPEECATFVDGEETSRWPTPLGFDKPFHMIVNLAIQGDDAHTPDANTPFPARLHVAYVRAWSAP